MATLTELRAKWSQNLAVFSRYGIETPERIVREFLADLESLERASSVEAVTLKEASLIGGYSIDHLQRLVASQQIENVGRKGKPRIRRGDVPTRPGHRLPTDTATDQLSARRRIVASVATRNTEAS